MGAVAGQKSTIQKDRFIAVCRGSCSNYMNGFMKRIRGDVSIHKAG